MNGRFEDVANKISQLNEHFAKGEMTDEDWELQNLAIAMYSNPGNMEAKVRAIWQTAVDLVKKAEALHEDLVTKSWESQAAAILTEKTLERKAAVLSKIQIPLDASLLAKHYCAVIRAAGHICSKYWDLHTTRGSLETETIELIMMRDFLYSPWSIDNVIGMFFPLQLYCYELRQILYAPRGTMAGKAARARRAAAGGDAAKHGEEILRKQFMEYFNGEECQGTYSSMAKLWDALSDPLEDVLDKYKRTQLGTFANGRRIAYGKTITPDGIPKLLNKWKKMYPDFAESIRRHLGAKKSI